MKETFVIHAEARSLQGKGASRRLRREGKLPAVLYGGDGDAVAISLGQNELKKHSANRAFFSQLMSLELDGKTETVVLKDLQRHPVREHILHLDLKRVRANQAMRSLIPLDFSGGEESPGVKINGGVIEHILTEVEVECMPQDLPEFISVDLSALDIGDVVRISDLQFPDKVESVDMMHERDHGVATVHRPRAAVEAEAEAEGEAAEGAEDAEAGDASAEDGDKANGDAKDAKPDSK